MKEINNSHDLHTSYSTRLDNFKSENSDKQLMLSNNNPIVDDIKISDIPTKKEINNPYNAYNKQYSHFKYTQMLPDNNLKDQELKSSPKIENNYGDISIKTNTIPQNTKISDNKELLIKETFDLIQIGFNKIHANDKEIVLVIGNTGSGKSTLINYLANKELYVCKNQNSFKKNAFLIDTKDLTECKIGHNPNKSETSLPNRMATTSTVYWDCPGFEDTRGFKHSIANQFYISRVLDKAEQVKILVVINDVELSATRGQVFETLINRLNDMFDGDLERLLDNVTFIFTKVEGYDNVEDYKSDLKTQIIDVDSDFETPYKKILSSLIEKNRIAIFNSPLKEGSMGGEDKIKILSILENTDYAYKPIAKLTIDSNAVDKLIDLKSYANEKAGSIIKEMKKSLVESLTNLSKDELVCLYKNLATFKQKIVGNKFEKDIDIINFIRENIISNEGIKHLNELQQLSSQVFEGLFAEFFPDGDKIRQDKFISLLEVGFDIEARSIKNEHIQAVGKSVVEDQNNLLEEYQKKLNSITPARVEFNKRLTLLSDDYNKATENQKKFLQETFKNKDVKLEAKELKELTTKEKATVGMAGVKGFGAGLVVECCLCGFGFGIPTIIGALVSGTGSAVLTYQKLKEEN